MKDLTIIIKIKVRDIKINDRYFDFKYDYYINGKIQIKNKIYEGDHDWSDDKKLFRKMLKDGHAFKLVLERIDLDEKNI